VYIIKSAENQKKRETIKNKNNFTREFPYQGSSISGIDIARGSEMMNEGAMTAFTLF